MKIVHVFKDAYPPLVAGITRYISDLASEFARRGDEVSVVVAGVRTGRIDEDADGVRIVRCAEWTRALSMPISPALARAARQHQADVLHVHMPNPIGEWGVMRRRGTTPYVATFHAQLGKQRLLAPFYRPLQRSIVANASSVFVSSDALATADELEPALRNNTLNVLPFGVSPKLIGARATANSQPQDVSGRGLRVLFVGRLVYYKGIDVLLDALEQLPEMTLTVVGEGVLGPMLEARSQSGTLAGRVDWKHDVDDEGLRAIYADHDVFVLPSVSRAEAFGLAMAEGMANGLAIISTRLNTGTDWVNEAGVTGLVVTPGDVGELTEALRTMAANPARRAEMARAAAVRAETYMSFQKHADAIASAYASAVASVRSGNVSGSFVADRNAESTAIGEAA